MEPSVDDGDRGGAAGPGPGRSAVDDAVRPSRLKTLLLGGLVLFGFALLAGCRDGGDLFPDADVTALRQAMPRLACTIRHSSIEEYGKLLHTDYFDGFLKRDAKIARMKELFDSGLFTEFSYSDPAIRLDSDKATIIVTEHFRYENVERTFQDRQEWRKEAGVWKVYRQWQPDPSLPIEVTSPGI